MKRIKYHLTVLLLLIALQGISQQKLETVLQKGHSKYMTCYDFSPDGQFLISGSLDNSLILWNVETGKQIRSFSGHTEGIRTVRYSPDGLTVLSASKDNRANLYEVISGQLIKQFVLPNNDLHGASFSPDGAKVILTDGRDGLLVYDTKSGDLINKFTKNYAAFGEENLFSPLGNQLLTKNGYEGVSLVDIATLDTIQNFDFDKSFKMSYTPAGDRVAVSSTKLFAKIFEVKSGRMIAELKDKNGEQCDGCNMHHVVSQDGQYVLTASNRTKPSLWSIDGQLIRQYDVGEKTKTPTSMKINSTNDLVLVAFSREVYVYDLKSGRVKMHENNDQISYFDFSFSPDGQYIALPSENNSIGLWSAKKGKRVEVLEGYLNHEKNDGLRFSYDNWTHMGILKYISFKKEAVLSPDAKSFFIGNVDSLVLQIDVGSGKVIRRFQGHSQAVWAYDVSPDGKVLATAGGDRQVILWNLETGKEIERLKGHREVIFDLDFSSDGKQLITSSWDGTIRKWDLETGRFQGIDLGNNSAYTVGFGPDDLYFISGDLDKNVSFYEVDAAAEFRTLVGHTRIISDFDFNKSGELMASASWDGSVKLWDVRSGMLTAKMKAHTGQVYCLDFDPSERFLASGGGDNDIVLWDYKENRLLDRLKGHSDAVTSVQFLPDGQHLLSSSADGMIKLWDLTTATEIYSRVQISREEWIATSPGGYFDGSSKALGMVNYVSENKSIKLSSLFDKFYSPGLIERISNGESFNDQGEQLNRSMENTPSVAFHLTNTSKRSVPVESDSTYSWKTDRLPLDISINSKGRAVEEVRIYNNGKLVVKEVLNEDLVFRGGAKDMRNFEIPLYDGDNEISAVVINEDRTESEPAHIFVSFSGEAAKTDLYILSIGINSYKNSSYNLSYAVSDAKAFNSAVSKKSDSLFSAVYQYQILNQEANRENILKTLKEIQEKIGPEDVFVFYYAGHGVMAGEGGETSDFYIVTHDITNLYGDFEALKDKAVSASQLLESSIEIAAAKQLYVIDACHSGAALGAFAQRGGAREKALAQLARSSGTFFLTASQDMQFANEAGSLEHGLFTYALLEVLGGKSGASYDNKITVNEMKSYVEDRVPELSEEYHGSAQYPASYSYGQDFPIVIIR